MSETNVASAPAETSAPMPQTATETTNTVQEQVTQQVQEQSQPQAETQEQPKQEQAEFAKPLGTDGAEEQTSNPTDVNLFQEEQTDKEAADTSKDAESETETKNEDAEQQDSEAQIPDSYILQGTDGKELPLNEGEAEKYQKVFKDAGLTQKQARMMIDAYKAGITEATNLTIGKANEFYKNAYTERNKAWREQLANDKEFGGEHIEETRTNIARVMQRYATPELRAYLNKTGECFNPEIIRLIAKIGKDLGSDNFVGGNGVASRQESSFELAKRLYPNSPELWK